MVSCLLAVARYITVQSKERWHNGERFADTEHHWQISNLVRELREKVFIYFFILSFRRLFRVSVVHFISFPNTILRCGVLQKRGWEGLKESRCRLNIVMFVSHRRCPILLYTHDRKASQRNINKNALSSLRPALHLVRQHMGHFQITEHDMNTRKTAERCCRDDKLNKSLHLKVIRARFPI